jgi:hypothetical protein
MKGVFLLEGGRTEALVVRTNYLNIYLRWRMKLKYHQGAHKLMGENLKVIWAEFSTLSWAVFLL